MLGKCSRKYAITSPPLYKPSVCAGCELVGTELIISEDVGVESADCCELTDAETVGISELTPPDAAGVFEDADKTEDALPACAQPLNSKTIANKSAILFFHVIFYAFFLYLILRIAS